MCATGRGVRSGQPAWVWGQQSRRNGNAPPVAEDSDGPVKRSGEVRCEHVGDAVGVEDAHVGIDYLVATAATQSG